MKIAPQVVGIFVLAAILVAALRSEPGPDPVESPFQEAARKLRIGMTMAEARSATELPEAKPALAGSSHYLAAFYYDRQRRESLILSFQEQRGPEFLSLSPEEALSRVARPDYFRLVDWRLEAKAR